MRWSGVVPVVVLLLCGAVSPAAAAGVDTAPATATSPGDTAAVTDTGAVPGAAVTSAETGASNGTNSQESSTTATYTYRLVPDSDDTVSVTVSLSNTSGLESVTAYLYDGMSLVSTAGFESRGDDYVWDGGTSTPSLTYHLNLSVLETSARDGDTAVVSTGWGNAGLVARASGGGFASVTERQRVAGEGRVVSAAAVVLGPSTVTERTVDGQTVRVVVPGSPRMHHSARFLAGALANASRSLDAGEDEVVTGIVASSLGPLTAGSAIGEATFLALGNASVTTWIHEYVHTQQEYSYEDSMRWFTEGSAEYYGAQLAVRHGYADVGDFQHMLLQTHDDASVLAKPDTWEVQSDYYKGSATIALLDRQIRTATDGQRTFRDVFRRLNAKEAPLNATVFVETVRAVGGDDAAATARKYVTTDAIPPERWDSGVYGRAFGTDPPDVTSSITEVRARGGDYNRSLTVASQDLTVAVNETLALTLQARNAGGRPGLASYNVDVEPAGSFERSYTGSWTRWLSAGESATWTVTHRFTSPGKYYVSGVGTLLVVHVKRATGSATVTDLAAAAETGASSVRVEATVTNDDSGMAVESIPVVVDGERVAERQVVLKPGESGSLSVDVQVTAPGEHTIAVGDAETTVDVEPTPTPTPTRTPTPTQTPPTQTRTATTATSNASDATPRGDASRPPTTERPRTNTTETTNAESGPGFGPFGVLAAFGALAAVGAGRRAARIVRER